MNSITSEDNIWFSHDKIKANKQEILKNYEFIIFCEDMILYTFINFTN